MIRKIDLFRVTLIALMLLGSDLSTLLAETPTEQVKETISRAVHVVQDPNMDGEEKRAERRERLRRVLLSRFDFAEMAKRSLGNHWGRYGERQAEFVSAFTEFVENSYVTKIELLKDEKLLYTREQVKGNLAQVDTKVVPIGVEPIPIHYRLHLVGREWKIYDVVVEGVSLVANYRSQIQRILTMASFEELLRKLQEKTSEGGS